MPRFHGSASVGRLGLLGRFRVLRRIVVGNGSLVDELLDRLDALAADQHAANPAPRRLAIHDQLGNRAAADQLMGQLALLVRVDGGEGDPAKAGPARGSAA